MSASGVQACRQALKPEVRYVAIAKQLKESKCLKFLRERYLRHDKHFAVFPLSLTALLQEQQEAGGGDVTVVLPDSTTLRFFIPLLQVKTTFLLIEIKVTSTVSVCVSLRSGSGWD